MSKNRRILQKLTSEQYQDWSQSCILTSVKYNKGRVIIELLDLKRMKDILKKLQVIDNGLKEIDTQINEEARIQAEELAERKHLGLKGSTAIAHYNEWMDKHDMGHLKVLCGVPGEGE